MIAGSGHGTYAGLCLLVPFSRLMASQYSACVYTVSSLFIRNRRVACFIDSVFARQMPGTTYNVHSLYCAPRSILSRPSRRRTC
ncbi:hypothetical protein GE09DRAFT_1154506 [Coniochaeta sp. 2T2.1]|nr:hypothetical protein GE09DRAFT_1154506 [Coniochaeta sp. 2T2.1]